jgi:hypothetical protein
MTKAEQESAVRRDFHAFVAAKPVAPRPATDAAILRRVAKDLCRPLWKIWSKLTLVQVAAGLATLLVCPQFGLGVGADHGFLHGMHAATPPVVFYLLCGLSFVSVGALLGGLILGPEDIRRLTRTRHLYFCLYGMLAYLVLVTLGTQAFVVSSLAWIPGAVLGNLWGFTLTIHLRRGLV